MNDPYRKEAILSLRNALVSDGDDLACPDPNHNPAVSGMLIPGLSQGAVSFFFKPRFDFPRQTAGAGQYENWTLFCMPFVVKDEETEIRCGGLADYAGTKELRKWFTGQVRLAWSRMPGGPAIFNTNPEKWPYVVPFGSCTQVAFGPQYFPTMQGLNISGIYGNVLTTGTRTTGTTSGGSLLFSTTWTPATAKLTKYQLGAYNPAPAESLMLEFTISKYASIDESMGQFFTYAFLPGGGFPLYHWNTWNAADDIGTLGRACAYTQPAIQPLNLFDTSVPTMGEYHTVRKAFFLNHPISVTNGRSLLDSDFHHQLMVTPGRWNHFMVVWQNMWNLLSNNTVGHRGGSLAVYLNGHLNRTVTNGGFNYSMAGMFVQSDYCEGYKSDGNAVNPINLCPWEPGSTHPFYNVAPYTFRQKICYVPWGASMSTDYLHIPWFGEYGGGTIKCDDLGYQRPSAFEKVGYLSPYLHRSTPPRLYFGCQPVAPFNIQAREHYLKPFGIPFGTFMDIQVFGAPAGAICEASGGFKTSLSPGIETQSILPNTASTNVYPLNLLREVSGVRVAGVRWTAHLPEFHKFWDDQNALIQGPDKEDSQQLRMTLELNGSPVGTFGKSQDPLFATYAPPLVPSWQTLTPVSVNSRDDLKLTLQFKTSEAGMARNTTSTPILEDIEVTLLGPAEFSYLSWD